MQKRRRKTGEVNFGKFSEIKYERPDFKNFAKEMKSATTAMKNAETYEEFRGAFSRAEEIIKKVETTTTVSYIRNTLDLTDKFYDEEQKYLNKASGTKGYFDLLKVANLENPFDEKTVKAVSEKIEKVIDDFSKKV